ncbi:MAG: zinc ribbon domain-containing protein [Desulfatiglandales bacterium]
MFFFFIGGIQPKTVELENKSRLCPVCGLARAKLRRVDHYLSLFFIPLFRVRKGEPLLICDRCGVVGEHPVPPNGRESTFREHLYCRDCGNRIEPGFRYCPFCGRPL